MVDGTVSMVEGLGYKAIDSNELRRKQKNSTDLTISPQIRSMIPENPSITSKLGFEAHRAKSSPARNLQQALLEESLILEAKERASHAQGESAQFTCQSSEVQLSIPKLLYNARGNPYVEGDPNLGYSPRSLKSRYTCDRAASSTLSTHSTTPTLGFEHKPVSPPPIRSGNGPPPLHTLHSVTPQNQQSSNATLTHQPHPHQSNFKG